MRLRHLGLAAVLLGCLFGNSPAAEDIAAAHPNNVKVEFENAKVRVMRLSIAPHQKLDLHETSDLVTIPLTDYVLLFKDPAGKVKEVPRTAGKAVWVPAGQRSSEAGDKPVEAILVELKSPAPK